MDKWYEIIEILLYFQNTVYEKFIENQDIESTVTSIKNMNPTKK